MNLPGAGLPTSIRCAVTRLPDSSTKAAPNRGILPNAIFWIGRSEEHTSELQSLMRISYAVFCLKKKKKKTNTHNANLHTQSYSLHRQTKLRKQTTHCKK